MSEKKGEIMNLFERDIEIKAKDSGDLITIDGWLTDSYHEMTLSVDFSFPDLIIKRIEGKMIRYPHQDCLPGIDSLKNVLGIRAGRNFFQKIEEAYGGPRGCVHLLNLLYEAGLAAVQARFAKTKLLSPEEMEAIPKERLIKMYLKFQPGMRDSCIAWSNESPMVKEADSLPE